MQGVSTLGSTDPQKKLCLPLAQSTLSLFLLGQQKTFPLVDVLPLFEMKVSTKLTSQLQLKIGGVFACDSAVSMARVPVTSTSISIIDAIFDIQDLLSKYLFNLFCWGKAQLMGRGERTAVKKIFLSVILTVFTSNNQSRNYKCFPDINSIIAMNRNRSNSRSSSQSSQRDSRQRDPPPEPSCRLFVGGIDPDVSREEVRDLFEQIGSLQDFFFKQQEGKDSFCFVQLSSQEEADNAIQRCNGKRLGEKAIFVKYSRPRPKKEGEEEPRKGGFSGFGGQRGGDREERGNRGNWGGDRGGDRGNRGGFGGNKPREQWNKGDRNEGYQKREKFEDQRGGFGQGKGDYHRRDKPNFESHNSKPEPTITADFDY